MMRLLVASMRSRQLSFGTSVTTNLRSNPASSLSWLTRSRQQSVQPYFLTVPAGAEDSKGSALAALLIQKLMEVAPLKGWKPGL